MTTEADHARKIQAMAKTIKTKASAAGMIVLIRDQDGKAHVIPGSDIEIVAIYSDKARVNWVVDDLLDAAIHR